MNAGPSSDFPPGNDLDQSLEVSETASDAALWRLLGRAPLPEPDAWFATRAMARCRTEKRAALGRVWRWALGGGLGVCLAISLLVSQVGLVNPPKASDPKDVQEAFEIMASIDNSPTTDSDSSASASSWQDSSL